MRNNHRLQQGLAATLWVVLATAGTGCSKKSEPAAPTSTASMPAEPATGDDTESRAGMEPRSPGTSDMGATQTGGADTSPATSPTATSPTDTGAVPPPGSPVTPSPTTGAPGTAGTGTPGSTPGSTAGTSPEGSAPSTAGVDTTAEVDIVTLVESPDPTSLADRPAKLEDTTVRKVTGKGIWVGPAQGKLVFVAPVTDTSTGKSKFKRGQRVNITGTIRRTSEASSALHALKMSRKAQKEVVAQEVYIEATEIAPASTSPSQATRER